MLDYSEIRCLTACFVSERDGELISSFPELLFHQQARWWKKKKKIVKMMKNRVCCALTRLICCFNVCSSSLYTIYILSLSFSQKLWQRSVRKCNKRKVWSRKIISLQTVSDDNSEKKCFVSPPLIRIKESENFSSKLDSSSSSRLTATNQISSPSIMQPEQKMSPFAKFRQLDRQNSMPKWV